MPGFLFYAQLAIMLFKFKAKSQHKRSRLYQSSSAVSPPL